MTDTFIVDDGLVRGRQGADDARGRVGRLHGVGARRAGAVGVLPGEAFGAIASGIYSGTAMLNRLLSRQGLRIGAIVTAGQEDYLKIERGIQTYLGYSYSDRLHLATHYHNPPLVPRERMKGVRGRIDVFGDEVAPLREQDARQAAAELLDAGVDGICVCLLFSTETPSTRSGSGRSSRRRRQRGANGEVPVVPLLGALSAAPRPAAPQLDPDRGLRRRALAGHAEGGARRRRRRPAPASSFG